MSASRPTYYEVLGVSPSATQADIRKRYRELARRYHPDVATAADAADRFKEINEANRVLSDPDRRSNYDAELRLAQLKEPKPAAPESRRPTTHDRPPAPERPTPNAQRPSPQRAAPASNADRLVADARAAFRRLRYREAEGLLRQALRFDRRNAAAYELLGDIHRARGSADEAIAMYSYALQLNRTNRDLQAKFDRLVGQPSGPTMSGNAARASRRPLHRTASGRPLAAASTIRILVSGIGLVMLVFLLVMIGIAQRPTATSPILFEWDPLLLFALAASGIIAGLLLASNGLLGPARAELAGSAASRGRRSPVPVGAILIGFTIIFFYAAFLVYTLIAVLHGTVSRSIVRAFATAAALVGIFALVSQASALYVLLFGGNLVFLCLLAGWAVGDAFRQ